MSLLNMLKMVNNAAMEASPPPPRTPGLHDAGGERASSPEIDVDAGGVESPKPQLSPADIKACLVKVNF